MDKFTKTFTLSTWNACTFRVRHRAERWQEDVVSRMAVVEVLDKSGAWVDFMTVREPAEIAQVERALAPMPYVVPDEAGPKPDFNERYNSNGPNGRDDAETLCYPEDF